MESRTGRGITPDTIVIGTGNVASAIARLLASCNRLIAVAGRTIGKADAIASRYPGVKACTINDMPDATFYICAVTDSAISQIAESVTDNGAIWIHTAGSIDINVWKPWRRNYGVLYPLQTISSRRPVDPALIPWFIEADSDTTLQRIKNLAESLGGHSVTPVSSEQRARLHIAAVMVCNFTNYLFGETHDYLSAQDLDLTLLRPLVERTIDNTLSGTPPHELQTGPAVRGNWEVMKSHIDRLPTETADTYRILSRKIFQKHHPDEPNRL